MISMKSISRPIVLSAIAAVVSLNAGIAGGESPAIQVADGKPWNSTMNNGRSMRLTLNPNGSARMKMGIMRRTLTWTPTADGLCLHGMPDSPKCVKLTKVSGGYVGSENGKQVFVLSRK